MPSAIFECYSDTESYDIKDGTGNLIVTEHFYFDGMRDHFYFGKLKEPNPGPQAYTVDLVPKKSVEAHFHDTNQFQIFFGSVGSTFQRHEIGQLLVHYTDAYTVYGPFGAGETSLQMFTLRQQCATGEYHLPDHRELLQKGATRRHFEWSLDEWLEQPIPNPHDSILESLVEKSDGAGAYAVVAGPDAKVIHPTAQIIGGRYYVVIDGEVKAGNQSLPVHALVWCPPDAEIPELVAGPSGARLLLLQFGPPSERVPQE